MGIASCLLEAIKATYKITRCALKGFGKLSDVFQTHSGIKQGAPSSVILFIIFMDDLIDNLKNKCVDESIIKNLHSLLHADDTLVLSLERNLFIAKCNNLIDSFHVKKLQLNLKKSLYMIVNRSNNDDRIDIKLKSGWLPYAASTIYLGALFTDTGILSSDIQQHAINKNKSVSIKFASFVINHIYGPITVKKKIFQSCITSTLLYACETWSYSNFYRIETIYRKAVKICTKMKWNTPNEIVYIESGCNPFKSEIYKRQFKFWQKIKDEIVCNPDSPIVKLYEMAIQQKLPFISHYINLHNTYSSADECYQFYLNDDMNQMRSDLVERAQRDNVGSRGTYLLLNPKLLTPEYYNVYRLCEIDGIMLTKYRSGSHYLNVQKGRCINTRRNDRLCPCGLGVQDISHILFTCILTSDIRQSFTHNNLVDFFNDIVNSPHILRMMEHKLMLR